MRSDHEKQYQQQMQEASAAAAAAAAPNPVAAAAAAAAAAVAATGGNNHNQHQSYYCEFCPRDLYGRPTKVFAHPKDLQGHMYSEHGVTVAVPEPAKDEKVNNLTYT